MRPWLVLPVLAAAFLAVRPAPQAPGTSGTDPHGPGHVLEVQRIQAHFDSVLAELPEADVSRLSPAQRDARARLLARLRAYRHAAQFPHNYDFPGEAMPYFIDPVTGTRCAVAHLMDGTGAAPLVLAVAAADNNVWVPDLAGNPAFASWLDANGLTLAEAARIQVPYMGDGNPVITSLGSPDRAYLAGSLATALPAAAAAAWNLRGNADGHRTLGTVLGLTTGALALTFGSASLGDSRAPAWSAPMTLGTGAFAAWLSTRSLLRHRSQVAAQRAAGPERRMSQVRVSPYVAPQGRQAGMALSLTF